MHSHMKVSERAAPTDKTARQRCAFGARGAGPGHEVETIGKSHKTTNQPTFFLWFILYIYIYLSLFLSTSFQRGKFYPQLSYLIKVNTPRAVMQETKKAFRKLPNLEQALTALSNLKGVGTTMASALLAAAAPDTAPFMADECLMAIPEIEGIDYTTKEYLNFVTHIQTTVARLNSEKDINNLSWSAHR